jgi:site-specific DNA recombinase
MELGDPDTGERGERSPLDVVLDKLNAVFAELLDTVDSGGLDRLSAAEKVVWWQRFETFRNRLPLIEHGLIADAEATDLAGGYSFSDLARFLVRMFQLSPGEAASRVRAAAAVGPRTSMLGERLEPVLPRLAALQRDGAVTVEKVQIVERAMHQLSRPGLHPDDVATAERLLTDYAPVFGTADLRRYALRVVDAADPDGPEPIDEQLQQDRRYLELKQRRDGMWHLQGRLNSNPRLDRWRADRSGQGDSRIKAPYTTGMTAVTYCRISADRTGAGLGVERQAADCRDLAMRLGLGDPEVLTDNDLSAYSGKRRPGYQQLLEGLKAGRWSALLVWHVDRLCRNVRDLEDIVDLVNGRVAVHTVKGGEIDLETPEGRLQARMLGTLARYESEHRSDSVRRALDQLAETGKSQGGPRPYGWLRDQPKVAKFSHLDPAEAGIVAELTRRVIGGESIRSLAAELNKRGVPSVSGVPWSASSVKNTVIRPRNAKLREHRGEIVGMGDWPTIVSREEWEAAHALLTDPARRTSPGNAPARLMSGLMTCGVCRLPVRAGGSKGGVPVYRCSSGKHVKRRVELVDGLIESYVLALLEREQVGAPAAVEVPNDVRGQGDAIRLRLEQLEDKYSDGDISRSGYLRNRDRLAAKLAEFEREEALLRVPGPLEGITPDRWAALPLDRRRAVVSFLVKVVLMPTTAGSGHHNPKLVQITPKKRQ